MPLAFGAVEVIGDLVVLAGLWGRPRLVADGTDIVEVVFVAHVLRAITSGAEPSRASLALEWGRSVTGGSAVVITSHPSLRELPLAGITLEIPRHIGRGCLRQEIKGGGLSRASGWK